MTPYDTDKIFTKTSTTKSSSDNRQLKTKTTMDFSKYEHLEINDTTKISELYLLGFISEFIYKDCKLHGLEEAENILCEWDWEDGWDLGDDTTNSRCKPFAASASLLPAKSAG